MIEVTSSNCIGQQLLAEFIKYIVAGIKDTQGQYLEGMGQEREMILLGNSSVHHSTKAAYVFIKYTHTHICLAIQA